TSGNSSTAKPAWPSLTTKPSTKASIAATPNPATPPPSYSSSPTVPSAAKSPPPSPKPSPPRAACSRVSRVRWCGGGSPDASPNPTGGLPVHVWFWLLGGRGVRGRRAFHGGRGQMAAQGAAARGRGIDSGSRVGDGRQYRP